MFQYLQYFKSLYLFLLDLMIKDYKQFMFEKSITMKYNDIESYKEYYKIYQPEYIKMIKIWNGMYFMYDI